MIEFNKRVEYHNPIYPYSWTAEYADGSSISQFSGGVYHLSREIDREKIINLVIHGHPGSPIAIPRPDERTPDEILIKAECSMDVKIGVPEGVHSIDKHAEYYLGYIYGADAYLLKIDRQGRLFKVFSDAHGHTSELLWESGIF